MLASQPARGVRVEMAQKCLALYDYQARDPEELSIRKHENLVVVDSSGSWWKVQNEDGKAGLVPSNYVKKVPDQSGPAAPPQPPAAASTQQQQQPSGRTNLSNREEPGHMYHQPDLMMPRNGPASLNIRAVAKYKYLATREDELGLEKGDEVIVMEKEADGWWRGRNGARIGWFPFNYVEEVGGSVEEQREKVFICGVVALYSFNSGNPEELAFQKGDLLDIVDQPQDDPDWWEARKADGLTGLVPRNYVEVVPDAEPVFGAGHAPQRPMTGVPLVASGGRPPPPFVHEVWFHGRVARRDAEAVLNEYAQNGQFIVRESETKASGCTLSVC